MRSRSARLLLFTACLFAFVLLALPMRAPRRNTRPLMGGEITLAIDQRVQIPPENAQPGSILRSSAPRVVRAMSDGSLLGVSPGRAEVCVDRGLTSTQANVVVPGVAVRTLSLSASSLALKQGQMSGLSALINADATDRRVFWESLDQAVATVDGDGRVVARAAGETDVICTTPNGLSAKAKVRVSILAKGVVLEPQSIIMLSGDTIQLETKYTPEDATDPAFAWRSTDKSVATVDGRGRVKACGAGSCVITLQTMQGLSASCEVDVTR